MKDLYDLINIRNINIEDGIRNSIAEVKEELNGLDTERMCQIYTSYLYLKLKEKNIVAKIIDTKDDLNFEYKHRFLIVPKDKDNNYVIDLTYSQFLYNSLFNKIYNDGFQLMNSNDYKDYLNNILESINRKRR